MAPPGLEPPTGFLCPITLELMSDPVIASDDHTCASLPALHGSLDEAWLSHGIS